MEIPSFKEDHISQIPALQFLQNMGYTYLTPEEALAQRGGKTSNVLLEGILREQLKKINSIRASSTKTTYFSDANIENGIRALKEVPLNEGYVFANEVVYNLLTLGKSLEQTIDGDKKSFTLRYIDWENIENNIFHVSEEFSVMRSGGKDHYRPDVVLFVNGIPLCVIECKRPDMKEPLKQAISQHLRNQQPDGIRNLYVYAQMVLGIATDSALFATNATIEKFWSPWTEKCESAEARQSYETTLHRLKNTPISPKQKDKLFSDRYRYVRQHFDALAQMPIQTTVQDEYLYNLCRPERLLDLVFNFMLFENGIKKVARHQQYFSIKKNIRRIQSIREGKRQGGVIWHTQGSGKSLTMVLLAQAIALDPNIRNPKIVLVTDRTDLDDQITKTFRKCGKPVNNATTGHRLVELLESNSDAIVTTVINKFSAAVRKMSKPLESANIFVLVDEGHRTQHGIFNIDMQKTLPNACVIAMTGTPLFKKDKNTAQKFGGIIDTYTINDALRDKAVVPLLYEGRLAAQNVNENPIDRYFTHISEPLTEYQKSDLKKKFSRKDQLNEAEQKIYAIAWDISLHFKANWQGTGFKAQLVCSSKHAAIRYKTFLDDLNIVSSEVLISSVDEREGEDNVFVASDEQVAKFWKKMMEEHGNAKMYEKNLINRFKNQKDPEIIIVVDKLLTGFDEPKNTVLYLTRNLSGHKLLQAIARVNRLHDDKDFGYIVDYYGVIENLDEALGLYGSFEDFDAEDLEGTFVNIHEEIQKLPQKHSDVWEIFKTIANKRDVEAFQVLLKDEAIRTEFYDKLTIFAKAFKLALSAIEFHEQTPEKDIDRYKNDLAMFLKLRSAVMARYSDVVDYKQYEGQIQKLIDTHITTDKVETITSLVNIFDQEAFQAELEKTLGTAAKADKITSRTAKHISEKMEDDPAFYKKFSEMLKDTIADYETNRIDETQYLERGQHIMQAVLSRTDSDIPETLQTREVARAFYGLVYEMLKNETRSPELNQEIGIQTAFAIDEIVLQHVKVNWQNEIDTPKKMIYLIGEYLLDEVRDAHHIPMGFSEIDDLAEKCVEVAKRRYAR